jgi:glycosidase
MVPQAFWLEAREAVKKVNPSLIWLSETVHGEFVKYIRDSGFEAMSDSETYEAFDICYDYDIHNDFLGYVHHHKPLNDWLKAMQRQEYTFPKNYIKLRNLENHDQERIAHFIKDPMKLLNMTATLFFLKGATMIYAGQEYGVTKRPDLFEVDKVDLSNHNLELRNLIHRMSHLKKDSLFQTGLYNIHLQDKEAIVISYENKNSMTFGIFNVGQVKGEVEVKLPDGTYQNILYPNQVVVKDGKLTLTDKPMVLFGLKQNI